MLTRLKQMGARIARVLPNAPISIATSNDELESHLTLLAEDHIRRGMTPEQARRAARLELGGLTQIREAHRETRGVPFARHRCCRICATRSAPCAATPDSPPSRS